MAQRGDNVHMPWRLYRYILGELLRQVLLTTAILVTIIAFGAVIKPLAGDSVLTAGQALKYIGLAMIPMLQYALPFAAGFGATLTLHRLASENEIIAMATNGLSYRTIFGPVLLLGAVLFIIMVILTQAVIPQFFGLMAATLKGDVQQLISTSVKRGVPFKFSGLQIYAEDFQVIEDPVTSADERMLLRRVVASQLGDDGMPASDVTAASAIIDLYHQDHVTLMKIAMDDTVSWDASSNSLRGTPRFEPTHAIPVPRPDRTDPENLTRWELEDARAHPERSSLVEETRNNLLWVMNDYLVSRDLNERLKRDGSLNISKTGPVNRSYRIEAEAVEAGQFISGVDGQIVITEFVDGVPNRRFRAASASLLRQQALGPLGGLFLLDMVDLEVESLSAPLRPNRREKLTVSGLAAAGDIPQYAVNTTLNSLLMDAEQMKQESPSIVHALDFVDLRTESLMGLIDAQVVRRSTLSVTAFMLLMLGAMLAALLRSFPPLGVYICAFLPALLDLILIASGTGMVRGGDYVMGTLVAWSGNGILAVMIVFVYYRLNRN